MVYAGSVDFTSNWTIDGPLTVYWTVTLGEAEERETGITTGTGSAAEVRRRGKLAVEIHIMC